MNSNIKIYKSPVEIFYKKKNGELSGYKYVFTKNVNPIH